MHTLRRDGNRGLAHVRWEVIEATYIIQGRDETVLNSGLMRNPELGTLRSLPRIIFTKI